MLPPDDFKRLFQTGSGHDLAQLADHTCLKKFLAAQKQDELLSKGPWKRITQNDRPYSLRYGLENVSRKDAGDELKLAEPLVKLLVEKCS